MRGREPEIGYRIDGNCEASIAVFLLSGGFLEWVVRGHKTVSSESMTVDESYCEGGGSVQRTHLPLLEWPVVQKRLSDQAVGGCCGRFRWFDSLFHGSEGL